MLNKMERFQQWRGSKASAEQHLLKSALLISDFVDSVTHLEVIKATAETKYKDFDRYKVRSWGTIIFGKLFIEEARAQLNADNEKELLDRLSTTISNLYENWKYDTKKNVSALIDDIEKLILLEEPHFKDKKSYQTFIFSTYMMLQISKLGLDELDWRSQMVVGVFINIAHTKGKIAQLLQEIENKSEKLKPLSSDLVSGEVNPLQADSSMPGKNLLNQRYLRLLNNRPQIHQGHNIDKNKPVRRPIMVALSLLETDISKVSSSISHILDLKCKKAEIDGKIKIIYSLLLAAEENDQRVTDRMYFHDFIKNHDDSYQLFLENTVEKRKEPFIRKANQLKNAAETPDFTTEVINGVSWIVTPLTYVYRTATPQAFQNLVTTTILPSTLDSICKTEFKELATDCLANLYEKLAQNEQQISTAIDRSFHQDEAFKKLIFSESPEQLTLLLNENDTIRTAVQASNSLLLTVTENLHFLNDLKEKSDVLNEFIRIHDNFFVTITNFLAQFFPIFKTHTAKMIDSAATLKKQVDMLSIEYQNSIEQEMSHIEQDSNLDKKIKSHLKKQFIAEDTQASQEKLNRFTPNKHNICLLMNHLSQLFSTNPHPMPGKKRVDEEEHKEATFLI